MTWLHSEPDRQIVFLGDFIDRGPENTAVIRIVRELVDAGRAQAIMGNHELNAIHFHTIDPETGLPLRSHDHDHIRQHRSFLSEYPPGRIQTKDVIGWMKGLPLFMEDAEFRAVHAAWIQPAVDDLMRYTSAGVLSHDQLVRAGRKGDAFNDLAESVTRGPEVRLPEPYSFVDKGGKVRRHVRVKWWATDHRSWRQIAMSVPSASQLPDEPPPDDLLTFLYPAEDKPVFFGHYWLTGDPVLQGMNALCLDYSAGTDGPLVTYSHVSGSRKLDLANVRVHL